MRTRGDSIRERYEEKNQGGCCVEMDFGTHNFFCQFSSVSLEIFRSHVLYTQHALETGLIALCQRSSRMKPQFYLLYISALFVLNRLILDIDRTVCIRLCCWLEDKVVPQTSVKSVTSAPAMRCPDSVQNLF